MNDDWAMGDHLGVVVLVPLSVKNLPVPGDQGELAYFINRLSRLLMSNPILETSLII